MNYTDLVKRLRKKAIDLSEKFSKNAEIIDLVMRAAEAIEELQAAQKWIPVTEKLPKRRKWVLCRCVANIYEVLKYENAEWYHDPAHVYMFDFVTHWMPLPEPPKEEDDG